MHGLVIGFWVIGGVGAALAVLAFVGNVLVGVDRAKAGRLIADAYDKR